MNLNQHTAFDPFLQEIRERLQSVLRDRADVNQLSLNRGIPPFVLREVMSLNPLSVGIPKEYGGRGADIEETLALLEVTSYESLGMALTFGINLALFLQPVGKYALPESKQEVFHRFMNQQNMGGLMITEPGFGSDALNMQTFYTKHEGSYRLSGMKHWAGLTGWADFWLLTARAQTPKGDLQRDIDFFICDVTAPGQSIEVLEYFSNLGLYQIPYGLNKIEVEIPAHQKLIPESTGVKLMLDLLHRSRLQFPGMALGFIQRMIDEASEYMKKRMVGAKSLFYNDQVQYRLSVLQSYYTVCSAMCVKVSKIAGVDKDLSNENILANSIKCVVSDMMQESAQTATQLFGARAYKLDHIAGRGIVDSRPFQIFEGSNDMLYAQISAAALKLMKNTRESNLYTWLKSFDLTTRSSEFYQKLLNFKPDFSMPQRKMVDLGKILSKVISTEMVLDMESTLFRKDLINNALELLREEVGNLITSYQLKEIVPALENYKEGSNWRKS